MDELTHVTTGQALALPGATITIALHINSHRKRKSCPPDSP
jgi:hypothetical protein